VRELPLGVAAKRNVHYFWDYFSFFLFHVTYFSPRRCCHRVMKFCPPPQTRAPKKFRWCRRWAKRRTTIGANTRGTKTPTRVVNITERVSKPTAEIGGATGSWEITCAHNWHGPIPTYLTQECSGIYSQQKATPDFPVYLLGCKFLA
jgi:hypothetical protein